MASQFSIRDRRVCLFPGALGDFLCFGRALAGLRLAAPGPIRVVARSDWLALLPPDTYEQASIDSRAVAELFGTGEPVQARRLFADAAAVLSWTGHGTTLEARLLNLGVPLVRTFPFHGFAAHEHASDYYTRCMGVVQADLPIHVDDASRQWARQLLARGNGQALVVHAGSGSAGKNWAGFAELGERWLTAGGTLFEVRGPAEEGRAPIPGAIYIGTSLPRVAALLAQAPLYVGNDSGVTHLAAAVGTPGLALFGAASARWRPRSARMAVVESTTSCAKCVADLFCLHRLPLAEVETALAGARDSAQRWQAGQ